MPGTVTVTVTVTPTIAARDRPGLRLSESQTGAGKAQRPPLAQGPLSATVLKASERQNSESESLAVTVTAPGRWPRHWQAGICAG